MTSAQIIDGKAIARAIREEIKAEVDALRKRGAVPGLAVILVGEDPASQVYVRQKGKACEQAGIYSITENLPADIAEAELLEKIAEFNANPRYHVILIQLPLPAHINAQKVIEAVDPGKDVDCFHPENVGRLVIGQPRFLPATPSGILELLKRSGNRPEGKHVVVVGRSNIVGKPLANLLLQKTIEANALVTVVHSAAKDIGRFTRQAEILVAAIGRPRYIKADMVKSGVVVIDVGVNRVEADTPRGYRLVGDVDFDAVAEKARAITPVPGGVGPMTIAMLLKNTLTAFRLNEGI